MSYIDENKIKAEYAPYHTMFAFEVAYASVMAGRDWLRHHYRGVDEQAYDRGVEAACRVKRITKWVETNIGSN
jgi:hypothetical protein